MKHIRTVSAEQFDLCSICGVYAELDDLEKIICYACIADEKSVTAKDNPFFQYTGRTYIHTIEMLAHNGQWHPDSAIGIKIAHLRAQLTLYNRLADEQEQYVNKLHSHIKDCDWDSFDDGANEFFETLTDLEQELDLATNELESLYRTIGDLEAQLDEIHPAIVG